MLKHLSIANYALIDKLEMSLEEGLTVITGETGAGKSILLGALSLLLGNRADTSVVRDSSQKCVVEGLFQIKEFKLEKWFEEFDLDYEDQTLIRREILDNGKSRAFVNDTPVKLSSLKLLGEKLIDIHSQHESLLLNEAAFQLKVLDNLAKNASVRDSYGKVYKKLREVTKELEKKKEIEAQNKEDLDYWEFQMEQLVAAKLKPEEQEELEQENKYLSHAEEVKLEFGKANELMNGENSLTQSLRELEQGMGKTVAFLPQAKELHERIKSAYIELADIATEVEGIGTELSFDPERAELVAERLDLIYSLQQKHKATSIEELLSLQAELEQRISGIASNQEEIVSLEKKEKELKEELEEVAQKLTETRTKAALILKESLAAQLKQLGIPNAEIQIELKETEAGIRGKDDVVFLFSANKNKSLESITKVASGGEIARIMLVIKYLVASKMALPTIIFDEIDTGVSGEIADKMGEMMKSMSANMQVLSITHLPQIAAKGVQHLFVYKEDTQTETHTHIKELSKQERIEELAKMLSGSEITEAAMDNARVLFGASKN